MTEEQATDSRIYISHWFQKSRYTIKKIEGDYVYFKAVGLKRSINESWNVNDDYNYGHLQNVRFSLCNVEIEDNSISIIDDIINLPSGVNEVCECSTQRFCSIRNCTLGSFIISGITFIGNAYSGANYLVNIENNNIEMALIDGCTFKCMESDVVSIGNTSNVTVSNCRFIDCCRGCIHSDLFSQNTHITKCIFEEVGLDFENSYSIMCQGSNYLISDNTIRDYGHCAIRLGYGRTRDNNIHISGITEYNKIEFTKDYIDKYHNDFLMDNGAIYIGTQNDMAIVRYNDIGFVSAKRI